MSKTRPPAAPLNRLLAKLPGEEYQRLLPYLRPVDLPFRQVLYEPDKPIRYAYFINVGVVSVVSIMEDGKVIEVGTIGREGAAGVTVLLGAETVPYQYFVQTLGEGMRVSVDVMLREAGRDGPLRTLLLQYHSTFLTQTMQGVACNGLHTVQQRLCRWLLMFRDRVDSDELNLTHQFLSQMLGVRRSSVGEVLAPLQERGLIHSTRSKVVVLDRAGLEAASCECYRVIRDEYDRLLG